MNNIGKIIQKYKTMGRIIELLYYGVDFKDKDVSFSIDNKDNDIIYCVWSEPENGNNDNFVCSLTLTFNNDSIKVYSFVSDHNVTVIKRKNCFCKSYCNIGKYAEKETSIEYGENVNKSSLKVVNEFKSIFNKGVLG